MFLEEEIIERLITETPYTSENIKVAEDVDIDLTKIKYETLPRISVGHIGTELNDAENIIASGTDGYGELGIPELLVTQIQVVCLRVDYPTVKYNIKLALQDWTPIQYNIPFSIINFHHSELITKLGEKVRWCLYFKTEIPRLILR